MNCIGKCTTEDQQNDVTQKRNSKKIDQQLQDDFKEYQASPRIMVTGNSNAGKATIAKQIRLLHGDKFTTDERIQVIKDIRNYIKEAIETIVYGMRLTPAQLACPENQSRLEYVRNQLQRQDLDFPSEFYEHVKILWQDEGVRACFQRSNNHIHIQQDCAQYFLDKIDTVKQPDFTPSDQDLLRCKVRRARSSEIRFQVNKYNNGSVFDFSLTNNRLRAFLFSIATVQIHVVDVSGCNVQSYMGDEVHPLQESLSSFEQYWHASYWVRCQESMVLLLNKQDVLAERVLSGRYELDKYFPEFAHYTTPDDATPESGEDPHVTRAKYFIRGEFLKICEASLDNGRRCYPHFTCAVDTEHFRRVFDDCWEDIQSCHGSRAAR